MKKGKASRRVIKMLNFLTFTQIQSQIANIKARQAFCCSTDRTELAEEWCLFTFNS